MVVTGIAAALEYLALVLAWAELFDDVEQFYNDLVAAIEGAPPPEVFSYEERVEALKRLTGQIAALDLDIACYPTGYATTLLFDRDGNLLP